MKYMNLVFEDNEFDKLKKVKLAYEKKEGKAVIRWEKIILTYLLK